jgi:DNA polymerase-3 subunit alpha
MSLFGAATGVQAQSIILGGQKTDKKEALAWERELVGLYLSDHPLKEYETYLTQGFITNSLELNELGNQQPVRVAGLVISSRPYKTKTDKMMGFVTLEDLTGNIELVIFPRAWDKFRPLCEEGKVILAVGKVDAATTPPKVLVDEIRTDFTMYVSADHPGQTSQIESLEQNFELRSSAPLVRPVTPVAVKQTVSTPQPPPAPPARQPAATASTPKPAPTPGADDFDDDDLPPEPDFPDDWHLNEPTAIYAAPPPPTPMDDMLELERLAPVIEMPAQSIAAAPALEPLKETVVHDTPSAPNLPLIVPPQILAQKRDDGQTPRMMTITLRPSGDPERDRRRIKNIYFILMSQPGKDRFQFQIFEGGRGHLIDFPNDTTRITPEMLERLKKLIGEECWRIEEITFQ